MKVIQNIFCVIVVPITLMLYVAGFCFSLWKAAFMIGRQDYEDLH